MMEAFALYLLKSVIWLTGFAIVYLLFLRNERFFRMKRYYLVAGILISLVFPFVTFHYQVNVPQPQNIEGFVTSGSFIAQDIQPVASDKQFDYRNILLVIYLTGIFFFLLRTIRHVIMLVTTIRNSEITETNHSRIIRNSGFNSSFSFFNYVFVNPSLDDNELEVIMNHELVHITQKHWIDLLLIELLCFVQWVNPLAWIYSGLIRQNHEYIADEVALQKTPDPAIYKAVLVNQLFGSEVISLSNSFNFSLNKKRFEMMKKITASPFRKIKILFVIPLFALVFYAFSRPEYNYIISRDISSEQILTQAADQLEARGTVVNENGEPLQGVRIIVSKSIIGATTDSRGRFLISNIPDGSSLIFSFRGYKTYTLPPLISSSSALRIILVKDPEYKAPAVQRPQPLVVIDGVISDKHYTVAMKELGYNLGPAKLLSPKEAIEKYGEKGVMGVYEITTRKKALEMGIKSPLPKLAPEDFPTFQGQKALAFNDWAADQIKYPAEAMAGNIEGWITVNFTVELDGTISNIVPAGQADPVLSEELVRVVRSSPKWDPPKNPEVDTPFNTSFTAGFKLPDKIIKTPPFVVVEEMPQYPGGEMEILKFIALNMQYPEAAKAEGIEGRVIVRFIVNTEGNTEGISVLKGVHPLLDAEAIRVVSKLSGFRPGMQDGSPVNVWYMVPINFTLNK